MTAQKQSKFTKRLKCLTKQLKNSINITLECLRTKCIHFTCINNHFSDEKDTFLMLQWFINRHAYSW